MRGAWQIAKPLFFRAGVFLNHPRHARSAPAHWQWGGLVFATLTTLLVLPSLYAVMQRNAFVTTASLDPDDPTGGFYEATTPAVA